MWYNLVSGRTHKGGRTRKDTMTHKKPTSAMVLRRLKEVLDPITGANTDMYDLYLAKSGTQRTTCSSNFTIDVADPAWETTIPDPLTAVWESRVRGYPTCRRRSLGVELGFGAGLWHVHMNLGAYATSMDFPLWVPLEGDLDNPVGVAQNLRFVATGVDHQAIINSCDRSLTDALYFSSDLKWDHMLNTALLDIEQECADAQDSDSLGYHVRDNSLIRPGVAMVDYGPEVLSAYINAVAPVSLKVHTGQRKLFTWPECLPIAPGSQAETDALDG